MVRYFSDEHRKHLSEAGKGKVFSKEHRKHIGEAMSKCLRGIPKSAIHRLNMSLARLGKYPSEVTRKRMSASHMGHFVTEETKRKIRASNIGQKRSEVAKQNMRGEHSAHWNGGIRHHEGYIQIFSPNHPFCSKKKYVCEHRLIIEKLIGRYLQPMEQVHHFNRKKTDNRPQNLMAFVNNSAHRRFENGGKIRPNEIIFDGRLIKH